MSLRTHFEFLIESSQTAPTGYNGGNEGKTESRGTWASGTGANQADKHYKATRTISGSGNEDVDVTALTDDHGNAIALAEVRAFGIKAPSTNGDAIRITVSGSNGWTALLSGSTDYLTLQPGAELWFKCGVDGSYPVSGTNKSLNFANQDGSAVTYELHLVGTSA